MMVTPLVPEMVALPKLKMEEPSPVFEDSSIIVVAMGLGEILFAGEAGKTPEENTKGIGAETLIRNKVLMQYM